MSIKMSNDISVEGCTNIHMIPFFYGNSYKPCIFYFQKLVNVNKQAWTAMYKLLTKLTCSSSSGEYWPSVIFVLTYNSCTCFVLSQLQASIPQLTTLELDQCSKRLFKEILILEGIIQPPTMFFEVFTQSFVEEESRAVTIFIHFSHLYSLL